MDECIIFDNFSTDSGDCTSDDVMNESDSDELWSSVTNSTDDMTWFSDISNESESEEYSSYSSLNVNQNHTKSVDGECEASNSCRESNDCRSSTTDRDTKNMMNMESEASNCKESGDNGIINLGPTYVVALQRTVIWTNTMTVTEINR